MERHDLDLSSKRRRVDSPITGDISNPKGEDSSIKLVQTNSPAAKVMASDVFRLYFKGLVSDETVVVDSGRGWTVMAGFGVAICDQEDNLLYEIKEPLSNGVVSRKEVKIMALIRGLSESIALGIRNIIIYCDDHRIYQLIIGRGKFNKKIVHLVEEVQRLKEKMASSEAVLVARNDIKFAFRLAREVINSQNCSSVDVKAAPRETCVICLEETDAKRMFFTDECIHRYCFSCVKQFVEVKLLSWIAPTCLNDECKLELTLETCSKVLTPKLIEMWKQKMKEDSIPAEEKIYCPYPSCSMLMSKTELSSEANQSNVRTCVKCCGLFCINCKVPSHSDLSCDDYKKLDPHPLVDDMKLKSLASDNMWRQCVKCRHMVELSHGCNHITCGYEFCYACGNKWKKNQHGCRNGCLDIGDGISDDEDEDEDSDDDDD
ncbi:E3 ubiquitin-protein ligase RSL1 [Cardamine amara subsp. amara]|uniref:RBR-type E3 ubiquitin transferase n=1 Tax=Cardamine amara subsp. amara TaxID=228776 RepID=A0ABD1C606_CARAN